MRCLDYRGPHPPFPRCLQRRCNLSANDFKGFCIASFCLGHSSTHLKISKSIVFARAPLALSVVSKQLVSFVGFERHRDVSAAKPDEASGSDGDATVSQRII